MSDSSAKKAPNHPAWKVRDAARSLASRIAKTYARRKRHAPERKLIETSGLFDVAYYRTQTDDRGDAIAHYLTTGAREGLNPHPLFDTRYYRKRYPDAANTLENPFAHYLARGGIEGRHPNPYFDGKLYRTDLDEDAKRENPLVHYVRQGAREGRRASRAFDDAYYLRENPDVAASGEIPLVHYLRIGAREGRSPHPNGPILGTAYVKADAPTRPTEAEWAALCPHRATGAVVDVIVPVFRGEADTLRSLHRVLASTNTTAFELIVIDDRSPEPALVDALVTLAARGLFTLLRNDENLGFVATVNRGMALHPDRDVVLLNSDTEVFGDWLDRLRAVSTAHADIGTITPFSNSATICSYPTFPEDNAMALELPYAELDSLSASANADALVDIPTAVGFCMYIARPCLDATGPFDEARFGKGYGEENDFCRRAVAKGFRNVLAANTFVRHTGGASFQGEKAERIARALDTLHALHPDYAGVVDAFVKNDPVRPLRERLDIARLRRALGGRAIAYVSHGLGGGTEQHVRELIAMCERDGVQSIVLRPDEIDAGRFTIELGIHAPFPNLPTLAVDDPDAALRFFEAIGVRHVHVHHLFGLGTGAPSWVTAIARSGRVTVDFTVHDYTPICPRVNLIDASGVYCGEPPVETCVNCIAKSGSEYGFVDVPEFRAEYRAMLASVRRAFVPNADVRDRLKRHYPELEFSVVPHAEPDVHRPARGAFAPGDRLKVVVLGGVGSHKGFEVLVGCAEDAQRRRLPLDFIVVGHTRDDARARRADVVITGAYTSNDEAFATLETLGAHACFFPAVWPETYSYTLSMAIDAELHPVAFAFGAIAERLGRLGGGTLIPVAWLREPGKINDVLVELGRGALPGPLAREARAYRVGEYYGDRV